MGCRRHLYRTVEVAAADIAAANIAATRVNCNNLTTAFTAQHKTYSISKSFTLPDYHL